MSNARSLAELLGTDSKIKADDLDVGQIGGRRNLIINGAMQVAQRGTSATGQTTSGYKTCDRFAVGINSFGTHTIEQSTDAPPNFKNSLKITCTTPETSPSATDYVFVQQAIEGQNLSHINFGSSDAQQMTLSFWVKSNKTGTIGQEFQTSGSIERTVDVTINAADTWEYKTVLVPANTANTINETNATGLVANFWLNAGSTYKGTPVSTWGTGNSGRAGTLTANIGGATSDYFQITGVQLEVGTVATPFEHRSYGEELALCQRYYYQIRPASGDSSVLWFYDCNGGGLFRTAYWHPVEMRVKPTISGITYGYNTSATAKGTQFINTKSVTHFANGLSSYETVANFNADAEL